MGVVIDFADKSLRAKIKALMQESEKIMDEYNAYRAKHPNAEIGSPERKAGIEIYKRYLEVSKQAMDLAPTCKGDFFFANKYTVLSRKIASITGVDGTYNINIVREL